VGGDEEVGGDEDAGADEDFPFPHGPSVFHFDSGRAGHTSHTITPITWSSRPEARPTFSP
jgi:hypothetical protein